MHARPKPARLLALCALLFSLSAGLLTPGARAAPADVYAHRYVVLLNGITTKSDQSNPFNGDFNKLVEGLQKSGVSRFVYFSYSAANHYPNRGMYCLGWAVGLDCFSGNTDPTTMKAVYTPDDTKLPIDHQADVLDWLLNRIVAFDPEAKIDLVGFSLGGIVSSYWAATTGGSSPFRSNVRSLTLIESPVGGIPLAFLAGEDCGFLLRHPACNAWKGGLEGYFGKEVLRQLQLPGDAQGSIVDILPKAAQNYPLTSIQSTDDYLVNDVSLTLCGYGCFSSTNESVPIGRGTQYWVNAPHNHLHHKALGGKGIVTGALGYFPFMDLLKVNHNAPLSHDNTIAWVRQAIATLPDIVRPGGSSTIVKAINTPTIPVRPDILLLADTTGSMGSAISGVQARAADVINRVRTAQPDARFGAAQYKDFNCDASPFTLDQVLTADTAAVQGAITGSWYATGGCDTPEAQLNALYQLATRTDIGWRSDSTRIVAWFGDAPGHDPSNGHTLSETIAALQAAGIRVIAVDVGDLDGCGGSCGQATAITQATSGRFLPLASGAPAGSSSAAGEANQAPAVLAPSAAGDVADAILAGLQSLPVTVTPRAVGCDSHISITFNPPTQTVPSGTTATFTATVTVDAATPPAGSSCAISYLLDGKPVADEPVVSMPIAVPPSWSRVAPLVRATVAPSPGADGWSTGPVTVTLSAVDNSGGAGIMSLSYSASGGQTIAATTVFSDSEQIIVTGRGRTTLTFYAIDNVGNVAQRHMLVIQQRHQVWLPLSRR